MQIIYDYSKLRGRIVEKFGSMRKFAAALGVSVQAVSQYLNNKAKFGQRAIEKWCTVLEIDFDDAGAYFFKRKV